MNSVFCGCPPPPLPSRHPAPSIPQPYIAQGYAQPKGQLPGVAPVAMPPPNVPPPPSRCLPRLYACTCSPLGSGLVWLDLIPSKLAPRPDWLNWAAKKSRVVPFHFYYVVLWARGLL